MIDKDTPIMEICFKMVYKGMHRLYVVNPKNNKYLGIINRQTLLRKYYIYNCRVVKRIIRKVIKCYMLEF